MQPTESVPVEACQPLEAPIPPAPRRTPEMEHESSRSGKALRSIQKELCPICGYGHLHRKECTFLDACFALIPFRCSRCPYEERRFRPSWRIASVYLILLGSAAVGTWASTHRGWLHLKRDKLDESGAAALTTARIAAGGHLSSFEQMMLRKPRGTLDNATILKLWRANVGTDLILMMIRTSAPDYDVSARAIIEMKDAKVDQAIIMAMITADYNTTYNP
jgi:hypothetical protein